MPNRLAQESSPYLRQHANNPVDWYAWNEEALAKARNENKPILLSVGYSACHWCHVMEHECFENAEIAKLMNENFVNIKVDREERPDLDQIYQNVAQLIARSGGWPLTVFLMPDLRPFFGGTYFPPEDRHGRPGFPRVLAALTDAFKNDPQGVSQNAARLTDAIQKLESTGTDSNMRPDVASMRKITDAIVSSVDWHHGGFGGAPKFPNTMNLTYLWRYGCATGFGMPQDAVTLSLLKMAKGGIYDQLGGGFHRYCVDESWRVPHFEKMLYDNALLLKLYAEVLITISENKSLALPPEDHALLVRVLAETTSYVLREMKSPEGGFYSTQDADSEGEEGRFFVWNPKSLAEVLDDHETRAFALRYGVTEQGNFESHGQTVLHVAKSVAEISAETGLSQEATESLLARARVKLLEARSKRVCPARDDKLLAGWNGLMISGLAWASRALSLSGQGTLSEQALESAIVAMDFVRTHMTHDHERLWSAYKGGKARFNGYLDDYAFLAMGALDLARVLKDESEIEIIVMQARRWVDVVRKHFRDRKDGGYFFTSDDHEKLIQRPKTTYDQAIPSGNAVMIECLLALSEITGDAQYEAEAEENLYRFFPNLEKSPFGMGELACASLLAVMGSVTVSGRGSDAACIHPHIYQKAPMVRAQREHSESPAPCEILVCHRKTCSMPLVDPESAKRLALSKLTLT